MPRLKPAAAGHGFVAGGITSPASVQSKLRLFFFEFHNFPEFEGSKLRVFMQWVRGLIRKVFT